MKTNRTVILKICILMLTVQSFLSKKDDPLFEAALKFLDEDSGYIGDEMPWNDKNINQELNEETNKWKAFHESKEELSIEAKIKQHHFCKSLKEWESMSSKERMKFLEEQKALLKRIEQKEKFLGLGM